MRLGFLKKLFDNPLVKAALPGIGKIMDLARGTREQPFHTDTFDPSHMSLKVRRELSMQALDETRELDTKKFSYAERRQLARYYLDQ